MCCSKKYPYPLTLPNIRNQNFLGMEWVGRECFGNLTKKIVKCMKLNWNFQRGGVKVFHG